MMAATLNAAELLKGTTPGPWRCEFHHAVGHTPVRMYWVNDLTSCGTSVEADARLIAAAPALAARVVELEKALADVCNWLAPCRNYDGCPSRNARNALAAKENT